MMHATGSPKGAAGLCKEKMLKEERAEIAGKDLIDAAESTADETRTRARLNAKI